MKIIISFLFIIFHYTVIFGQFHYKFISTPDSAAVLINGKEVGRTPYMAKYYWQQKNADNQIIFSVQASGYESWNDTLKSKPSSFDNKKNLSLKRIFPSFKFDSSNTVLVAYDKLLFTYEDNKSVGRLYSYDGTSEEITWNKVNGSSKKSFENKFYETLTQCNIPSPALPASQTALFSKDDYKRPSLPRYLVGAQILEYNVNARRIEKDKLLAGRIISNTTVKIEWKVYDKATDKVVLSYVQEKKIRQRGSRLNDHTLIIFEELLVDFLATGKLSDLITNTKTDNLHVPTTDSTKQNFEVRQVSNPSFKNVSEMVKHVSQACVTIITDGGHGSGVMIDPRGYVLTTYHVVDGVNKIKIRLDRGIELDAQLLLNNKALDVAILKVNGSGFSALPFAKEDITSIGDEVLTIGTPADVELGQSISRGMISGKRSIEDNAYIQLDISVSPGNSGGPLLNQQGEIIGIIQKKLIGKGVEGIGFAIPAQKVKEIFGLVFTN